MDKTINPEALKSGKLLLHLKNEFLKNRCKETLCPLLNCLRDSIVVVPVRMMVSKTDAEKLKNRKEGEAVKLSDSMRCKPVMIRNGEKLFFPIFSNLEQIPKENREKITMMRLSVLQCLDAAKKHKDVEGLVLDAFTDSVVLEYSVADLIPKFESRLKKD